MSNKTSLLNSKIVTLYSKTSMTKSQKNPPPLATSTPTSIQQHFPEYPLKAIQKALKILTPIQGFTCSTIQPPYNPSSPTTTLTNSHFDPTICLRWNYGHLNTNMQDIHQLTNMKTLPPQSYASKKLEILQTSLEDS